MARKAAWEDLVETDLGPYAKSRGTNWARVFTALAFIAGATFVVAYYLPLHRAHQKLGEQYAELGQRAQGQAEAAAKTRTELQATTQQRDTLQAEHDQRESAKKSDSERQARVKAALDTKLDRFVKKGSITVVPSAESLIVAFDPALLFAPSKLDIHPGGRTLLCDVTRVAQPKSLTVRATLAEGAAVPAVFAKSFPNAWAFSAARAASVTQVLEEACSLTSAQLSALGNGQHDAFAAALASAAKLPADRVELELGLR